MSFRFKQFFVEDSKCAMKVGTDGVLIGCWPLAISHRLIHRVLDVGTGSGLVALMLAQRCTEAHIDAIDIEEAAVAQAKENFIHSPWHDRLDAFVSPIQDWQGGPYELIVSNPPYFQNSLKNPDKGRQTARHTDTLSYSELLQHSARLLTENGLLALILPAESEAGVREMAKQYSLYCTHVTRVYSKESKPARRVLLLFEKTEKFSILNSQFSILHDTLILEDDKGGRSRDYQELTKDFYL